MTKQPSKVITKDNALREFTKEFKSAGWVLSSTQKFSTRRLLQPSNNAEPSDDYVVGEFDSFLDFHKVRDCKKDPKAVIAYVFKSLPTVLGVRFKPLSASIITDGRMKFINTWKPYQPTSVHAKPLPSVASVLIRRMFPCPKQRHTMLQYIAHMIQKPDERPSWHVLLLSLPGTGKGYLFENVLAPLLTYQTELVNKYSKLTGQFSTILADSMLVLLDDPTCHSDSTATELKSLMSEERTYVERKFQTGATVPTYTRIILASNEDRPIPLDDDERRWFVPDKLVHKVGKKETQRVIARFDKWLRKPSSLDDLYHFFNTYSLEGFNHKYIEQTDALRRVIGLSANSADYLFSDFTADRSFFKAGELLDEFESEGLSRPSDAYVKNMLQSLGYTKGQFRQFGIKQPRIWCKVGSTQADYDRHMKPPAVAIVAATGTETPPF